MEQSCEACERSIDSVNNRKDLDLTIQLCDRCHDRFRGHALSPRQWYNLAKRYGVEIDPLCEDFYDENGVAQHPAARFHDPKIDPIPTFASVREKLEPLLDWCMTRSHLTMREIEALKAFGHEELLESLKSRLERPASECVAPVIFEIVGKVGDERYAGLMRDAWSQGTRRYGLQPLAEASSAALPEEGRRHVEAALAEMSPRDRYMSMYCLGYFRTPAVLDWIERHCGEPLMESWGNLAALSRPDWNRISRWLDSGRPLSLVALDTLLALVDPRTPLLHAANAVLEDPPTFDELQRRLEAYRDNDPVPRVLQRVEWIFKKPGPIFAGFSPAKP